MKNVIVWLIVALYLVCMPVFAAEEPPARCLGGICISPQNKDSKWLFQQYGKGYIHRDANDPTLRFHCYYDAGQQLWVELEFSPSDDHPNKIELTGIFVTKVPMCPVSFTPKNNFPDFVSEYGTRVGSTEVDLVKNAGKPQRMDNVKALESKSHELHADSRYSSRFGSRRLVYDRSINEVMPLDLRFNFYGLNDGRVMSIWFADRE